MENREQKELTAQYLCRNCKKGWHVSAQSIQKVDAWTEEGTYAQLMVTTCPGCGSANILQLDTMDSLKVLTRVRKHMHRMIASRMKGYEPRAKDRKKFEHADRQLEKVRERIMEEMEGTALYDKNGNILFESVDLSPEV